MPLSLQDWHNRFVIQAQWTKTLRLYFFDLIKSLPADRILDLGCGTGALLPDLGALTPADVHGADISLEHLRLAQKECPEALLTAADAHYLPYPDDAFDICLTHYFLMWAANPEQALKELRRVAKNGGYLVCFAEPDYGGRLDFPTEFVKLRDYQISALLNAGADPRMGRKLKSLFHSLELGDIQCGVYDGSWSKKPSQAELNSEWQTLSADLEGILSRSEIEALRSHELKAYQAGSRLVYVPTFYAWGKVIK